MWRFSIFISNIGSKYVLLVVNHTNTNSEDSKGLASAWSGDRIRTPNILRTPIKQLARTPLLHHSSICIVFGASWVQQLSILCVERYGMIHRIWKGGKSCVQSRFQHFSTTKSSSCHYCRSTKLLVFAPSCWETISISSFAIDENQQSCQQFIGSPNIYTSPQDFACWEPFWQRANNSCWNDWKEQYQKSQVIS